MVKRKVVKCGKSGWKPVSLVGGSTPFNSDDFEGLIGIEELTGYSLEDGSKKSQGVKKVKKSSADSSAKNIEKGNAKLKKQRKKKKKKLAKVVKNCGGIASTQDLTTEPTESAGKVNQNFDDEDDDILSRMAAWNGLGVPSTLLRALADKSFCAPTKIQSLTLPAAIFGRRDILGAAETGSGKTLAFGLPILNGILEQKKNGAESEKNCAKDSTHSQEMDQGEPNSDDDEELDEDHTPDSDDEIDDVDAGENFPDENEDADGDQCDDSDFENDDSDGDQVVELDQNEGGNSDDDDDDHPDGENIFDKSYDDGTTQCVKVIDNVKFDFSTGEKNNPKTKYIQRPLYALILTPTRELAVQISQHLKDAAKYTNISVAVVVGGLSSQKQERLLNRGPEIVIGTPGRLWELIEEGHPHLVQLNSLRYLAIDETDRMLEKGHFDELQRILQKINEDESSMKTRQNFMFSATLSLTHEPPKYVLRKKGKKKKMKEKAHLSPAQKLSAIMKTVGLTDPKVVDITEASGVAQLLTEAQIICTLEEKDYYLYYFLQRHPGRTLVFCNSIEAVRRLTQLFTLLDCSPWPIHAKMHQKARLKNLERFIASPRGVLLATDVAARGLDIPNVKHVIHYQTPRTAEGYVHRSGRTARAQQEGLTVLLTEPSEMKNFTRLFRTLGRDADLPTFPVASEWMPLVKQRVNLARHVDKLELQARRVTSEHGWLDKAVKDMDLEVSEDELPTSYSRKGGNEVKKQAAVYRKQLTTLLAKPIFPKGYSSKYPTQTGKLVVPSFSGSILANDEKYQETAVQTLKKSVEEQKTLKRKLNRERSKKYKKMKRLNQRANPVPS